MTKKITLEQLLKTPFDELISLYQQGYQLSEKPYLYPDMEDILPRSKSGYRFASLNPTFSFDESIKIGNNLNIDWNKINSNEFFIGINMELEHGTINQITNITNDDPILTGKIALAHLNEFPNYYTKLSSIEQ